MILGRARLISRAARDIGLDLAPVRRNDQEVSWQLRPMSA